MNPGRRAMPSRCFEKSNEQVLISSRQLPPLLPSLDLLPDSPLTKHILKLKAQSRMGQPGAESRMQRVGREPEKPLQTSDTLDFQSTIGPPSYPSNQRIHVPSPGYSDTWPSLKASSSKGFHRPLGPQVKCLWIQLPPLHDPSECSPTFDLIELPAG